MNRLARWFADRWCSWTHGGGRIKRDDRGRINWQCDRCGRWADPVPSDQERRVVDADLDAKIAERRQEAFTALRQFNEALRPVVAARLEEMKNRSDK